jgi:hypothetical protein
MLLMQSLTYLAAVIMAFLSVLPNLTRPATPPVSEPVTPDVASSATIQP